MNFSEFKDIEDRFETAKIKFLGEPIWAYLRIYAFDALNRKTSDNLHKPSISFLKDLFWTLPSLGKKEFIVFSSSDQRKLIDAKWHDRQDLSNQLQNKALFIELPVTGHKPKAMMASKYFYSKLWWYGIELFLSKIQSVRVEHEELLIELLNSLNCRLDYQNLLKRFKAQYLVSRFFFKTYKPKAIFLTTQYTNMPRILAAKELEIKVVEFQHGLISEKHNAYHIGKHKNINFYPDYLLSFGEVEKDILSKNNYLTSDKVLPIGSFYLGYLQSKIGDSKNPIQEMFKGKRLYCFSAQDMAINEVIEALNKLATKEENKVLFLPRKVTIEEYYQRGLSKNIEHLKAFNTYETLLYSNIHLSLFSTCATEAIALGTPTILLNFDGHAEKHFLEIAQSLPYLKIIENIDFFEDAIKEWEKHNPTSVSSTTNHLFKVGYQENLEIAINKVLGETAA